MSEHSARPTPQGWASVKLSDVADVRLGRQRSPKHHTGPNMRPYLRAANVTWAGLDLSDVKEMHFEPGEVDTYRLEPGDILVAEASGSASEVGKPAMWTGEITDCCFQNTLIRVRPRDVDPRFLLYRIRFEALRGGFARGSRGSGIHHLGSSTLAAWPIDVPCLSEQLAIVDVLETYMPRLTHAASELDQVRDDVHSFNETIFAAAVDGRLVEGSLNGAEKLRLRDVASTSSGGTPSRRRPEFFGGDIPWIKSGELGDSTVTSTDETITEAGLANSSARLLPRGTLLMAMYGATVGKLGWIGLPEATTNQAVCAIQPLDGRCSSEYLWVFLRASRRALIRAARGGAQPNIGQQIIRDLELVLPVPVMQHRIVAEVEARASLVPAAHREIGRLMGHTSTTALAVLHAAFSGSLTRSSS